MAEMPHSGKHHRDTGCIGCIDHILVPHRAARLHNRRGAGLDRRQQTVREREERVRCHDAALGQRRCQAQRIRCIDRLARRDPGRIDTAHLARTDADSGTVERIDNGVGFDVLGDAEGKAEIGEFARIGRPRRSSRNTRSTYRSERSAAGRTPTGDSES